MPYVPRERKSPNPSQRIRMDFNSQQNRIAKGLPADGRPMWVRRRGHEQKEVEACGEVIAKMRKDEARTQQGRLGFNRPPKTPAPRGFGGDVRDEHSRPWHDAVVQRRGNLAVDFDAPED